MKERRVKDLTGMVFGRLKVLSLAGRTKNGAKWKCACQCGRETNALATHLKKGQRTSCGCSKVTFKRNQAAIRAGQMRGAVNSKRYLTLEDALSKDPLALLARFVAGLKGDDCAPV